MTTSENKAPNPKEVFEKLAQESHKMIKGFSANQSSEMALQFNNAWNTMTTRMMSHPDEWMHSVVSYYQNQLSIWMGMLGQGGSPVIQPEKGDRRFSSPEWEENPLFNYMKQSYLLTSQWMNEQVEHSHLDDASKEKLSFKTRQYIDAMSPSNFAATNPEVIKEALETKGQSLIDGLQNLMQDMEKGSISMTDESAFEIGGNLATTEGAVVYQNELIQLIQYKPLKETVNENPMLIVPPWINKFYILDLQPKNSLVRHALEQGQNVFIISWKNPDEELGDKAWEDYISEGPIEAIDVIREITGAKKVNAVAWCIGGTMMASALAVMRAKRRNPVASLTLLTTLLDFSDPGELGVFIDEQQVAQREDQLKDGGVMPGKEMAQTFAMLRANDLIWSYVVNNYLKGKTPPPFDILYWNGDSTNMTANMYIYYLNNMYLQNDLVQPGKLTMCGKKVDLGKIDCPVYFLSAIDDHIAPWTSTFMGTDKFSGDVTFTLSASGHIAGVINPPSPKSRRNYWINGELGKGSDHWLETAESVDGSWWPHWDGWISKFGGKKKPAPELLGNDKYHEIEPAPGSYVKERAA